MRRKTMRQEWLQLRERLLFNTPVKLFDAECAQILKGYASEYATADPEHRQQLVDLIGALCIDLQSYLKRWHLQKPGETEC